MAPEPLALAAGGALGALSGSLRIRRHVAESQLAASFPDARAEWLRETVRACYRHFGRETAVLMGGEPRLGRSLGRVVDARSLAARLRVAAALRGGAVVVTGHLGNWELGAAAVRSCGIPVVAVAYPQRGGAARHIDAMRSRMGLTVLYRGAGAGRGALRALQSGGVVALVADQHAGHGSAPVDFLGRPAWTSLGPARLSLAAGVPLFFAALVRDGHEYRLLHEEIQCDAPLAATRRWIRALETQIRRRPAQYFWFHRRWKKLQEGNRRHEEGYV